MVSHRTRACISAAHSATPLVGSVYLQAVLAVVLHWDLGVHQASRSTSGRKGGMHRLRRGRGGAGLATCNAYSERTVNAQSTHSQHTVNTQSTNSEHITFAGIFAHEKWIFKIFNNRFQFLLCMYAGKCKKCRVLTVC